MTNQRAQYEADQLHISELEAANERLQAKITEFEGMLVDYETKFDLIAENEAKRCIEFGNVIAEICATCGGIPQFAKKNMRQLDFKSIYTNFKKG